MQYFSILFYFISFIVRSTVSGGANNWANWSPDNNNQQQQNDGGDKSTVAGVS